MAKLDDLRQRLFRTRETFTEREGEPTLSAPELSGPHTWAEEKDPEAAVLRMQAQYKRTRKVVFWGVMASAVAAIGIAAVAFVYLGRLGTVSERNIEIDITSPEVITAGDKVEFSVRFKNTNTIALESVDLIFEYPEGALPLRGDPPRGKFRERVAVGRLEPGEEQTKTFEAFLFGKETDTLEARATIEYRPSNTSARFGKDTSRSLRVGHSPIGVAISTPSEATTGQQVEIVIKYVSAAEASFTDLSLDVMYPSGFTFESADPAPVRDNHIWYIGTLEPGKTGSITVRGAITGEPQEEKHVDARIGVWHEDTDTWNTLAEGTGAIALRASLLAVHTTINDMREYIGKFGDTVFISLAWRNNLSVSAQHVVIEAEISGEAFDYGSVSVDKGSFDGVNRKAIWNASSEPALRFLDSGESGTVSFSVKLLPNPPVRRFDDKNFTGTISTLITSSTIPEGFEGVDIRGRDTLSFPISSHLALVSRGQYFGGVIPNSGPLPPRVGQETTYTITWSLSSPANDIEGVTAHASMPSYMRWKQLVNPAGENITFNPDTGDITWDVGFLVAGTGFTRPARDVTFQVGLVPGANLEGSTPQLITTATAQGKDTFTHVNLNATASEVTSAVRSDSQVAPEQYRVAP